MNYLAAAILLLVALHYRRDRNRQANRAAALRQTVDALSQDRWEREIRSARLAQRDRRTARRIRVLRGELVLNAEAMTIAATAVEGMTRRRPVVARVSDN